MGQKLFEVKIPSVNFDGKIEKIKFEPKCILYFILYFSLYPCLNCPNTIIACHSRTLRDSRTGVLKKDFQQTFPSIHKYCPILPISISFETTTTLTSDYHLYSLADTSNAKIELFRFSCTKYIDVVCLLKCKVQFKEIRSTTPQG